MNSPQLRDLLDKVYEFEGLVHLAIKREDDKEDFLRLICKKDDEIHEICKSLNKNGSLDKEELIEDVSSESGYTEYQIEELVETENISIENSEYNLEHSTESHKESGLNATSENPEEGYNLELTELEINHNKSNRSDQETRKGKLVFSINDRFRFRKELFDNSDADFNNNLALVASMENYEEAEDYFLNELGMDLSNPVVREFLLVLKRYFK